MMLRKVSLPLLLALLQFGSLCGQQFDWVQKIAIKRAAADFPGLGRWSIDPGTETDPNGNVFLTGNFKDTLVFGTQSVISSGGFDFFIAKYNHEGTLDWINQFEGTNDQTVTDMDIDRNGNIYLTGVFSNELKYADNVITGSGAFVIKLDNAGALKMIKKIEGVQTIAPAQVIAYDDYAGFFLAGSLNGTVNFGCSTLTADEPGTKFIAYYNPNGDCQWANKFVASYLTGLAFDGYFLYLTGGFLGDATFGGTTITADFQDIYVAKCGMNGEWRWAFGVGGPAEEQARDIEIDHSNNVIITGFFAGTVSFDAQGTQAVTSTGANDIFVASYDPYMSLNWVRQAGGGLGNQYAFDIDVSAAEKLIITGSIIDETHFGGTTLTPGGEKSFLAAYDSDGNSLWALGTKGFSGDRGLDITTSHSDTYLTGTFFSGGEYIFGADTIQANADEIYVSKITNASQRFTRIVPDNAVNVQYSHNAWVDFDGDNDLDFLLTGANSTNDLRTALYENMGGDTFRPAGHPFNNLPQYSESEIAFLNINHDDRIDFMFMGRLIGDANSNRISLIENNADGFTDKGPLRDFGKADGYGTISVGDVNRDGFQDIFVSGVTGYSNGNPELDAFLYLNENRTFTRTASSTFTGLYFAASRFADLDNDEDLDLIVCGSDGIYPYQNTLVYTNDGAGIFSLSSIQLTQLQNPSIDVYDIDGDHDLDLLLTGLTEHLKPVTKLYRNVSGAFEELSLPDAMNRTASGSAKWGDYDNDGDGDILITGSPSLAIFLNDGGMFTELTDPAFESLAIGYASWADYDDDGDLDILATGMTYFDNERVPTLFLLRNEMTTKNASPAAPDNFTITHIDTQSVALHWNLSNDDVTPSASLTYNISVRNMDTDEYLLHPFSENVTGRRMVAEQGNVMLNNSWTLSGLEPGTYSIRVQSIDGGYRGSPWTTDKKFYAGPLLPPDNLTAYYDAGHVHLSWRDNSVNEEFFVIEKKHDGGFTKYDSVSSNVDSFADPTEEPGTRSYRIYAVNPLRKTAYSNTADIVITGVEFSTWNDARLYPNPALNSVSITVKELTIKSASLQIRNTSGMVVASEDVVFENDGEAHLNIGSLPPGVYFVQLNTARTSRVMKLVKK